MSRQATSLGDPRQVGSESLARPDEHDHIVQFYEDDAYLHDAVAQYLGAGLKAEESLLVIATQDHWEGFSQHLTARGFDLAAARRAGRLTLLDAHDTLARVSSRGALNWVRCEELLSHTIERALAASGGARLRVYGELVDLLSRDGKPDVAVRLEELWNELGRRYRFSLLCAYAMAPFAREAQAQPFHEVCGTHTHVLPTEDYTRIEEPAARLREVSLLQQRARSLETELEQRRTVENALREDLKARDEHLARAGLELRTPLTALQVQLQSLQRLTRTEEDPRLREHVDQATHHLERLSTLLHQLLDGSRARETP